MEVREKQRDVLKNVVEQNVAPGGFLVCFL